MYGGEVCIEEKIGEREGCCGWIIYDHLAAVPEEDDVTLMVT